MTEDDTLVEMEETTTDTKLRWQWVGTVAALALILSLSIITICLTAGLFTLAPVTQAWFALYSFAVSVAVVWTFGQEAVKTIKRAKD